MLSSLLPVGSLFDAREGNVHIVRRQARRQEGRWAGRKEGRKEGRVDFMCTL